MSEVEQIIDELVLWFKGDADRPAFSAASVKVQKLPSSDLARQYKEDPKTPGLISIGYDSTYYGTEENLMTRTVGNESQDRYIHFLIVVQGKKLYGPQGVLMQVQRAENMAVGFKCGPDGPGGRMQIVSTDLTSREDTFWGYTITARWVCLPLKGTNTFNEEKEIGAPIRIIDFLINNVMAERYIGSYPVAVPDGNGFILFTTPQGQTFQASIADLFGNLLPELNDKLTELTEVQSNLNQAFGITTSKTIAQIRSGSGDQGNIISIVGGEAGALAVYDPSNTTATDDGVNWIVTVDAKRYFLTTLYQSLIGSYA